jgi:hypothetical protein
LVPARQARASFFGARVIARGLRAGWVFCATGWGAASGAAFGLRGAFGFGAVKVSAAM